MSVHITCITVRNHERTVTLIISQAALLPRLCPTPFRWSLHVAQAGLKPRLLLSQSSEAGLQMSVVMFVTLFPLVVFVDNHGSLVSPSFLEGPS